MKQQQKCYRMQNRPTGKIFLFNLSTLKVQEKETF